MNERSEGMEIEFKDISDEECRTYVFPGGDTVTIRGIRLNVSASGGHRVLDVDGNAHYVPPKWIHLFWVPKPGKPPFAF